MTNCLDTSCEPMDVDISTKSAKECLSESPSKMTKSDAEVWTIKKYHIVRDKTKNVKGNITSFMLGLTVLFLSLLVFCFLSIQCCNGLDITELKSKLNHRLYGQPEVIDSLIQSLENNFNTKILLLYGGTGVGKTFTVSLALESFWNSTNVYHYTMPSFVHTFSIDTMLGLSICDSSIVVIDDLQLNDFNVKKQVEEIIRKSQTLNKNITVILIYNCDLVTKDFVKKCDDTFYSELSKVYDDINAHKSYIQFKPLTEEVLKLCVQDILGDRRMDKLDFDNIRSNFNVTLDGCKGVYKKIKFLNVL